MAARVMAGSLLGALVLFAWGVVSWNVLPFHRAVVHSFPEEEKLRDMIRRSPIEGGVFEIPAYVHEPGVGAEESRRTGGEWERKRREGPVGLLIYQKSGREPMRRQKDVVGFGIDLGAALLAALFLAAAAGSLPRYGMRVAFVALLGIFASVAVHLPYWNWMIFPAEFTLVQVADAFVGWLLAGLVLGALVRRPTRVPAPAARATPASAGP